ncbi:MAG: DEAD/DEAH box helicase [bacterium]
MIDLRTAEQLIDFGTRIKSPQRAREQLEGAVAIHNILCRHGVAYLADEVGMGKTYVALGALALFRHFEPGFRVLVIAPRENIQRKWMKELRNFVANNVKFPDLRVKDVDGSPVRALVLCNNLVGLVREASLDPDRDFFARLSSFSLPVRGGGDDAVDPASAYELRDGIRRQMPWLSEEIFDLRNKQTFKDNCARAICCGLPEFDLVIVDEGHNLKHGFSENVAARNRVLALALGHPTERVNLRLFPGYRAKARRVLFLSATPIEESYGQLWNQLDVLGHGENFRDLRDLEDEHKLKELAHQFLVRRVTSLRIAGDEYTKNLYRREWRKGGVETHDDPLKVADDKQKLIVALVQKKVSEILGSEKFNRSFQMGMLASFESFLETARVRRKEEDETGNFDDGGQTEDQTEREGIDVVDVNRLARSYRRKFNGNEMPHPKMDAVVARLSQAWTTGEKALVFVRRVASVKELKRKLDDYYDTWLLERLEREMHPSTLERFRAVVADYKQVKISARERRNEVETPQDVPESSAGVKYIEDRGGMDSFFAWFFRGEGPRGIVSGANIQRRFIQRGAEYSTFFEDNHVASLLGCAPGEVLDRFAEYVALDPAAARDGIRRRSSQYLPCSLKLTRSDRFEAVQAAAVEWMKEKDGPLKARAATLWHEWFASCTRKNPSAQAPEIGDWIELKTFFTQLRLRPTLRKRIWPETDAGDLNRVCREAVLRTNLLAAAARLGHAFIDLYVLTIQRLGSIELRAKEDSEGSGRELETARIEAYLDLLDRQMQTPVAERGWGAFDELSQISEHFDLILDVNVQEARTRPLAETARSFGALLRQQQPVGGMSGQINQTLVRQFRMPGYPLVLFTTDLLQEGEDLHTFCSSVHHYGISWTPSSMEQRVGRIDRVWSQTERRMAALQSSPEGADKLQVYFPHLRDTVEVLQVQRVLERMNTFLRLMHESLCAPVSDDKKLNVDREIMMGIRAVMQITEPLKSAFPVNATNLEGDRTALASTPETAKSALVRFRSLKATLTGKVAVEWYEAGSIETELRGACKIGERRQPFSMSLQTFQGCLLVHISSLVGRLETSELDSAYTTNPKARVARVVLTEDRENATFNITLDDDAMLGLPESDGARVAAALQRVVGDADRLKSELFPGQDKTIDNFKQELNHEQGDPA